MLEFITNTSIHCLILFTVLFMLFTFYVSKVARNAVEKELGHNISHALDKVDVQQINLILSGALNTPVSVGPLLKNPSFMKLIEDDSDTTTINNKWLSITMICVGVGLYAGLGFLLFVLRDSNVDLPNMMEILKENAITFSCIGVVEYLFFTNIAVKFIPAPPSLIQKLFIEEVNKQLA